MQFHSSEDLTSLKNREYAWFCKNLMNLILILDPDPELGGDVKVGNVKVAVASLCKAVSSDGTLAMAQILMPICYHPAVLASDRELWPRSCHKLKVNPSE